MRDRWDAESLRVLRELTSDLTSLLVSLEVARRLHGADRAIERSLLVAARMRQSLENLIKLLRE